MNLQIKCRYTECTAELDEAIREKMARFERIIPDTAYVEVVLIQRPKAQADGDKEAEIIVDIPGLKPVIRYVVGCDTYLEGVDRVLDKLDEAMSNFKNRQKEHGVHGYSVKERVADLSR